MALVQERAKDNNTERKRKSERQAMRERKRR